MKHIFKALRLAHKGERSAMVRYMVIDDSELGYKRQTEYFDFNDRDKCMLSIHVITHRPDFANFCGTEDGVKWMFDVVLKRIDTLNKKLLSKIRE